MQPAAQGWLHIEADPIDCVMQRQRNTHLESVAAGMQTQPLLAGQYTCFHQDCQYTTKHAGHFARHLATRHGECSDSNTAVHDTAGNESRLLIHLMQRLAGLEAKVSALLSPAASVDKAPQPQPACSKETCCSPAAAAPTRIRRRATQPKCMAAGFKPCASSLSFKHIELASIRNRLLQVTDISSLHEVVVRCARAALDGDQGRDNNPVYRAIDGHWEVFTPHREWLQVDDRTLCQYLFCGVMHALGQVLNALHEDQVPGLQLVDTLHQQELSMARQTPNCPGVQALHLGWLIPLISAETLQGA